MSNNQKFKKVCFQLDYADKPFKQRKWRVIAITALSTAVTMGLVALEYAVMGGVFGL